MVQSRSEYFEHDSTSFLDPNFQICLPTQLLLLFFFFICLFLLFLPLYVVIAVDTYLGCNLRMPFSVNDRGQLGT